MPKVSIANILAGRNHLDIKIRAHPDVKYHCRFNTVTNA